MPNFRGVGDRRRGEIVAAGLELLGELGWRGVTQRAVADRAGANPGLVHYYFGGSHGLRVAVTDAACGEHIGGFSALLGGASTVPELLASVEGALGSASDPARIRVITAVASLAMSDARIAKVVSAHLATARGEVAAWLRAHDEALSASDAARTATAIVALVDGFALHTAMDDSVSVAGLTRSLAKLVT